MNNKVKTTKNDLVPKTGQNYISKLTTVGDFLSKLVRTKQYQTGGRSSIIHYALIYGHRWSFGLLILSKTLVKVQVLCPKQYVMYCVSLHWVFRCPHLCIVFIKNDSYVIPLLYLRNCNFICDLWVKSLTHFIRCPSNSSTSYDLTSLTKIRREKRFTQQMSHNFIQKTGNLTFFCFAAPPPNTEAGRQPSKSEPNLLAHISPSLSFLSLHLSLILSSSLASSRSQL